MRGRICTRCCMSWPPGSRRSGWGIRCGWPMICWPGRRRRRITGTSACASAPSRSRRRPAAALPAAVSVAGPAAPPGPVTPRPCWWSGSAAAARRGRHGHDPGEPGRAHLACRRVLAERRVDWQHLPPYLRAGAHPVPLPPHLAQRGQLALVKGGNHRVWPGRAGVVLLASGWSEISLVILLPPVPGTISVGPQEPACS
jgi:hypothetical protein